jgi:hypothetical protein
MTAKAVESERQGWPGSEESSGKQVLWRLEKKPESCVAIDRTTVRGLTLDKFGTLWPGAANGTGRVKPESPVKIWRSAYCLSEKTLEEE